MNCTASSYFIPHSMRAKATKTGALKGTEVQSNQDRGDGKRTRAKGEREDKI